MEDNKKTKKEIKKLTEEISQSLKIVDDLIKSGESGSLAKEEKISVDFKNLGKIRETIGKLRVDIGFFQEGKVLALEIKGKVQGEYDSISQEERDEILNFVNESYTSQKSLGGDVSNVDQKKMLEIIERFITDVDSYIKKLNEKLSDLEIKIEEEESIQEDLRKQALKRSVESGDREIEAMQERANLFDREIEKLEILEDELSLAIMENEDENQIDGMRDLLNEKM